ncbi:MAG: hypothetical protein H5T41_00565 [Methanomassiliicoccales archaeon]|nr:hypothetical protein [Methanomassiliicoccales archaeon]
MNRAKTEKLLSHFFEGSLFAMFLLGLFNGDLYAAFSALFGLGMAMIPWFLKKEKILTVPFELNLWIFIALFLHNLGVLVKLYDTIWWWDKMTHFLSTSMIAAFGFVGIVIVDKYVDAIYLPPKFLPFFIIVFVGAMGVFWEIIEFIIDKTLSAGMQYSLSDTVIDLVFDNIAGIVVAILGPIYLRYRSIDAIVEEMKVEDVVRRITTRSRNN